MVTKEQLEAQLRATPPEGRAIMLECLKKIDGEATSTDAEQARLRALALAGRPPHPMDVRQLRNDDSGIRVVKSTEKLSDYVQHNLPDGIRPEELNFGRWLKGIVTGNWNGAEAERKSMAVGGDAIGGFLVPSPLSAIVIDLARNQAVVFRAGAVTIPMSSGSLDIARLTSGPTAYWKAENSAGTPTDIGTGRFTLQARTLMALVKSSVELIEDAPNAGRVIQDAISTALSLELDRAALRGIGAGNEPLGIRNWSSLGANYGAGLISSVGQVFHDDFSDAAQDIAEANGPAPDALSVILSPREAGWLDRMKDGEGNPVVPLPSWAAMRKYVTNQIPVTLGGGAESEAYVGDFSQLAIGMRTQISVEVTRVGSDSDTSAFRNLQVWIRAYLRADVVLLQPTWFVVLSGITA
jgi:HK97 family phage major capsid protein